MCIRVNFLTDDQSSMHCRMSSYIITKLADRAPLFPNQEATLKVCFWPALMAFFPSALPPPAGYSFHNTPECMSLNEMEMVEDY